MTVASKFMSSVQALLNKSPVESSRVVVRIDDIRQAMLDCMGQDACLQFPQVERRVRFASNLEALWYLRPELLMVISSVGGELVAQGHVERISAMFDGLLPKAMSSRSTRTAR
jgi:hypothetical protein